MTYDTDKKECAKCGLAFWGPVKGHQCAEATYRRVYNMLDYVAGAWNGGYNKRPDWFGWNLDWFSSHGERPRVVAYGMGDEDLITWTVDDSGLGWALMGHLQEDVTMHRVEVGVVRTDVYACLDLRETVEQLPGGVTCERAKWEVVEFGIQ